MFGAPGATLGPAHEGAVSAQGSGRWSRDTGQGGEGGGEGLPLDEGTNAFRLCRSGAATRGAPTQLLAAPGPAQDNEAEARMSTQRFQKCRPGTCARPEPLGRLAVHAVGRGQAGTCPWRLFSVCVGLAPGCSVAAFVTSSDRLTPRENGGVQTASPENLITGVTHLKTPITLHPRPTGRQARPPGPLGAAGCAGRGSRPQRLRQRALAPGPFLVPSVPRRLSEGEFGEHLTIAPARTVLEKPLG